MFRICADLFLLTVLLICQGHLFVQKATGSDLGEIEKELDGFLSQSFHNRGGLQVGVVKKGTLIYKKSFGNRDESDKPQAMTNDDFMHTASLTKQFTGWSVAQLISEGRLSLEDPVEKFLDVPVPIKGITVAEMLGHTHGLESPDELIDVNGIKKKHYNNRDALEFIFSQTRKKKKYGIYGNAGYNLLAEIIAKTSKIPFKEYIRQRILIPTGMSHSEIVDNCDALPDKVVPAYSYDSNFVMSRQRYFTCFEGSVGLKSNAAELGKWIEFVLLEAKKNTDVFKIFSTQISKVRDGDVNRAYGMGLFIEKSDLEQISQTGATHPNKDNTTIYSHAGNLSGFQHFMMFSPTYNLGVVVLSNSTSTDAELIAQNVFAVLASNNLKALSQVKQLCVPKQSEHLSGIYSFRGFPLNVSLVSDSRCLWLSTPGGLKSITERDNEKGVYYAGRGIRFVEAADTGSRDKARRLSLNDHHDLFRPVSIYENRFPVKPFLGKYRSGRKDTCELFVKDGKLFFKTKYSSNELYWSGDRYLRTSHPIYGAIRFVFAEDGEVLGLKISMNGVEGKLFAKVMTTKIPDVLEVVDSELPRTESAPSADVQKTEKMEQDLLKELTSKSVTDEAFVTNALAKVPSVLGISEPHIRIPLLYKIRALISQVGDNKLDKVQRQKITALDETIAKEIVEVDMKLSKPQLGWVLFYYHSFPLLGQSDFNEALRRIQSVWYLLAQEEQLEIAKSVALWYPLSAKRIASRLTEFSKQKEAENFISQLFAK